MNHNSDANERKRVKEEEHNRKRLVQVLTTRNRKELNFEARFAPLIEIKPHCMYGENHSRGSVLEIPQLSEPGRGAKRGRFGAPNETGSPSRPAVSSPAKEFDIVRT